MLGDFKKAFRERESAKSTIPSGILEYLSYSLPQGYDYIDIGNGFCMMNIPKGASIKCKLNLKGASYENLKKCKTFDDLVAYSINLQKPIYLEPFEDGKYLVEDNKFTLDEIINSPLSGLEINESRLMYVPPEFNQFFEIELTIEEKEKKIQMERVPNDSIDCMKFQNTVDDGLSVIIKVKMQSSEMSISIKADVIRAKSVYNVCESLYWYNEFAKGQVKIFGEPLNKSNDIDLSPFDEDVVEFWSQLLEIEKKFNVNFDVSVGVFENDVIKVRQLYTSLFLNTPYRLDEAVDLLHSSGEIEKVGNFSSITADSMYFRFLKNESYTLMGVKLQYVAIKYIFGEKVKSYNINEKTGEFEFVLEQAYKDIRPFTATRYFINEKELNDFLIDEDNYKNDFLNAKYIEKVVYAD